jgi:hypothetical protein
VILHTHWSEAELYAAHEDLVFEIIAVLREQAEAYESARQRD